MSNSSGLRAMMRGIRRTCGPPLQFLAFTSGLMHLTAPWRQVDGAIILMYHSVAGADHSPWIDPANHVQAKVFAGQMEFLARQRRVVALSELVAILAEGRTPVAGTVAITFDDGYLDNFAVAAPILDRLALPATLFLPTGYIDRGENQWVDQAYSAFTFRSMHKLSWGKGEAKLFNLDDPVQARACYQVVCRDLLQAGVKERRDLLIDLNERLHPTSLPPRLTLNWDEVRAMLRRYSCFEVGGHTLEHTDLTSISEEEAEQELVTCRQRITAELGVRPRHFSFCYGRTSAALRRLAAAAGFEAACGGEGLDPVIRAPTDSFRLPRVAGPASSKSYNLLTSSANTGFWRKLGR